MKVKQKTSSMATLACMKLRFSNASRNVARNRAVFELIRWRQMRWKSSRLRVPNMTERTRHPTGLSPQRRMPETMNSLPRGGCSSRELPAPAIIALASVT